MGSSVMAYLGAMHPKGSGALASLVDPENASTSISSSFTVQKQDLPFF